MKTAAERKKESQKINEARVSEEIEAIDQCIESAAQKGETSISLNKLPSKTAVEMLYSLGYHITDHSQQWNGADVEISWD
jgi:hypothetical protein